MVGVKGSIFWDVTKPKRKYYPPTPVLPPAPQLISGKIIDLETKQEIKEAQLVITDTLNNTLFAKNLRGSGRFDTKLRRQGTYRVFVAAPKYQKYKEIVSNVGDTLMVYMQPIKTGTSFVVKNIYFNTNDTSLTAESNKELDKQSRFLKENPNVNITIVGHTDSRGSDEYNLKLSEGRAVSVMRALIDRGIAPERLKAEGRGETQPVASNETEEGRAENRRIEIEVR
jgi:ompA family protein